MPHLPPMSDEEGNMITSRLSTMVPKQHDSKRIQDVESRPPQPSTSCIPHDTIDPFLLKESLHRAITQACHLAYKEAGRQF